MTAAATRPVPPPPICGNGHLPAGQRVGVGKARRVSWVMLGLLLTAGACLAFLATLASRGERVSLVAASHDLQPGRPITLSDLRTVTINADAELKSVAAERAEDLVGRVPAVPLAAGTLLNGDLFVGGSAVEAGQTVVGADLRPGEIPGGDLRSGDRVALIQISPPNATESGDAEVLTIGTVYSVDHAKDTGDVIVAVRVPLDRGAAVANAAGQKRLRLTLVPSDARAEDLHSEIPSSPSSTAPTSSAPRASTPTAAKAS